MKLFPSQLPHAVSLLLFCFTAIGQDQSTNTFPPHPRLLLNAAGIRELKDRIATTPWAKASWDDLKAGVDRALESPVTLPPRGGNWGHHYICPTHSSRLRQGRKIGDWQWEHICARNHTLTGDVSSASTDFDGNVIMQTHHDYARMVVDAGLVYQMTGDGRYARKAREILLAYADAYSTYPIHDNWWTGRSGRGGRVSSQALTEATWLIDVVHGADLVWSALSESDRELIAAKIFSAALNEIVIPQKSGIHNIQNRQNSAIGLVGFLLGDSKLIDLAIDGPAHGFRQQLQNGVLADGLWFEGSMGYHFFTIEGIWPLTEAARNCGIDLYAAKLNSMFDAPLALAMPDLVLPDFNDSRLFDLRVRADLYELGYARYGDAAYAGVVNASSRRGRLALLYGATNVPATKIAVMTGSRNLEASGYAILQQGDSTNATWLALKYGPHGGWHGHFDKNSFILYSRGRIISPDAGTHAYGSRLHQGWDRTSVAHNTLVADGKSQEQAQGRTIAFGKERGVDFAMVDAGQIYPGVRFIRTAAMLTPDLVVFVDQVESDTARAFDVAYHQKGEWLEKFSGVQWTAASTNGYNHLTDTIARTVTGRLTFSTRFSDLRPAIALLADEPTEVITGNGMIAQDNERVPILLQRRHTDRTAFIWAIAIDGSPVNLTAGDVNDDGGRRLARAAAAQVQVRTGKSSWTLLVNPQRKRIAAMLPNRESWRGDEVFVVR